MIRANLETRVARLERANAYLVEQNARMTEVLEYLYAKFRGFMKADTQSEMERRLNTIRAASRGPE